MRRRRTIRTLLTSPPYNELYLDNIAPTVHGEDAAKVASQAASMLPVWSDVTLNLEEMLRG